VPDLFDRLARRLKDPGPELIWPNTPSRFGPTRELGFDPPPSLGGPPRDSSPQAPRERHAVDATVEIGMLEILDAREPTAPARPPVSLHDYLRRRDGA
jgi:hypothetical protein